MFNAHLNLDQMIEKCTIIITDDQILNQIAKIFSAHTTNVKNRVEHTHKRDTAKSNFRDQNVFLQCGYQTFFFVNIFFNQLILNLN